ncbi:MAG TPA: Tad domain-containing protein [Gaiellaceae bacterium]|jgi:hypothetical protein
MLTRLRSNSSREHGAVMIVVAVALPVIAIMVSLAINVAHWYDYSRNLQLRADASALAAGDSYGAICANPGNANAVASIGKTAQLYAGPMSAASDVFYPYATTPTDLATLGQSINGAAGSNGYWNIPNLKAGTAGHYHIILNSDRYWHPGDTSQSLSFNMGSVCSATDGTETGPMVDVRVTQDSLPLFLPFLNLASTLNAHARVAAQGVGIANNLKPLGVRDPGATPCVTVTFTPTNGNPAHTFELTLDTNLSGVNQVWDNGVGNNLTMPPSGNVVVSVTEHSQGADHTCNTSSNPIAYDKILLLNTYQGATAPDPGGFIDPNQDGTATGGGWTKVPAAAPTFSSVEDDAVRQPNPPVTNTDQMTNTSNDDPATPPGQAFGFPNTLTYKAGDTYTLWVYGNTSGSQKRGVDYYVSTNDGATFPAAATGTIIPTNSGNNWYQQPITITSQAQLDGLQVRLTNERVGGGGTSTGTATVDEIYVQRSPAAGGGPKLVGDANGGGVTLLTNNGCAPDQYLSTSTGCGVQVCAIVQFDNGATNTGVTVNGANLNPSANPNCSTAVAGATAWISNVIGIAQLSGIHQMNLAWRETVAGGVPGQSCNGAGVCTGTFGVEQQAFGACNGDSGTVTCPADNSGPIVRAEIGEGLASTIGSFQAGSTHQLVVRVDLAGLSDALPADRCPNQCTLLRFDTGNTDGSVDCGTGNSTANVRNAMLKGCPKFGDPRCSNAVFCAPFTKSLDGSCNNLTRTTGFAVDCVDTNNNGSTIPECVGALIQTGGHQTGNGDPCDFNGSTGCAVNHWALGDPIAGGDPRIITTFIMYPGDLSGATGNTPVAIRIFASFYVTGWKNQGNGHTINCPNNGPEANEPAPVGATNASIWGHWITYTEPDAGGDGKPCNFQAFGDCAVVLTR